MGLYSRLSEADRKNFIILQTTFTISGILLIAAGFFLKYGFSLYDDFAWFSIFIFSNDPVFLGIAVLFLPVLAYLGFAKGFRGGFFKIVFFISLIVFLVFEMLAVVKGFSITTHSFVIPQFRYPSKYDKYDDQSPIMLLWDRVQREFHCCGEESYRDWQKHLPNEFSDKLPLSCCEPPTGVNAFNCTKDGKVYNSGCRSPFANFYALFVGITAGVLLISFIAQAASSISLLKKIRFSCSCGCSYSAISYKSYDCNCKSIIFVGQGCDSQNHLTSNPSKGHLSESECFVHKELINEKE